MDTQQCITSRRTIKRYKDIPLTRDQVATLLEAGRSAPSSGNIQNWKFIVIDGFGQKADIAESCGSQSWMVKAAVLIAVCADIDKGKRFYGIRGERLYSIQNCACAAQNMLLAAHSMGIGGAWVGSIEEEKVSDILNLNNDFRPQCILAFGHPDEDPPEPPKYTLENVMYFRQYGGQGNRMEDIPRTIGEYSFKVREVVEKGKSIIEKISDKISGK